MPRRREKVVTLIACEFCFERDIDRRETSWKKLPLFVVVNMQIGGRAAVKVNDIQMRDDAGAVVNPSSTVV